MSFIEELEAMEPLAAKDRALAALATAKWVKDIMTTIEKEAKAYLDGGHLKAGGRAQAEIQGVDVATVTRSKDSESWQVVDEAAYGAWLETHGTEKNVWQMRPNERVMQSSYLNLLRRQAEETGEVPDGVAVVSREGSVRVSFSKDQRAAMDEAARLFGLYGPLEQLTTGGEEK